MIRIKRKTKTKKENAVKLEFYKFNWPPHIIRQNGKYILPLHLHLYAMITVNINGNITRSARKVQFNNKKRTMEMPNHERKIIEK